MTLSRIYILHIRISDLIYITKMDSQFILSEIAVVWEDKWLGHFPEEISNNSDCSLAGNVDTASIKIFGNPFGHF